jgi:hypothetical protein
MRLAEGGKGDGEESKESTDLLFFFLVPGGGEA